MSYFSSVLQCMPNIQSMLADVMGHDGAGAGYDRMPFLEFLASEANNFGLKTQIAPGNGKIRSVEVVYRQRILESEVNDNVANPICTATDTRGTGIHTYELDTSINQHIDHKLTQSDLQCIQEGNPEYFATELLRLIDVLDRATATKVATQAVALAGEWSDDTESAYTVDASNNLELDLYYSDNKPDPVRYFDLMDAATKSGYGEQKVLFGGSNMHKYFQIGQQGCCADSGLELGGMWSQFGIATAYDRFLQTALGGAQYSLLTQPGALALLTFTQAEWKNGVALPFATGSNYYQTSIVSPRTGVPMDLTIKDDCGTLHINLVATVKVVDLPSDIFANGDNLYAVNFVNRVEAV